MRKSINTSPFSTTRRTQKVILLLVLLSTNLDNTVYADTNPWQTSVTPQAFLQIYSGSEERNYLTNVGAYLNAEYLESSTLALGYNYSLLKFDSDADLSEHLFYLSGRHNYYFDALPGKLELRLDLYLGTQTLRYSSGNKPAMMSSGKKDKKNTTVPGANSWIEEHTDLTAYQAQVAFTNHAKTLYLDLGYAHSEYDGSATTKATQWTPTLGFGLNDNYNWLQLRAYRIDLDETGDNYDAQHKALEGKFTHWYQQNANPGLEFSQLAVITGERLMAVDSDAAAIYSTTDMQTLGVTASAQWRLATHSKFLFLTNYSQFSNESLNDDYRSLLFYINFQQDW